MTQATENSRLIRFGVFEADLHTHELRKYGLKVKLQEQPFQVLEFLLERPGELVSREEIRAKLWPQDTFVDFEQGLNAAVRRLRRALNDEAGTPRFVETLPRRGYRFIAPVETVRMERAARQETTVLAKLEFPIEGATKTAASRGEDAALEMDLDHSSGSASLPPAVASPQKRVRIRRAAWVWLVASAVVLTFVVAGAVVWDNIRGGNPADKIVQQQLTANPSENPLQAAAISPDGKYLAYSDLKGLHLQLIKNGETQALPTPAQFVPSNVSWLPDGTGILVSGEPAEGTSSVWLISIFGGVPRKLRDDAGAPVASPDGFMVAFLGDSDSGGAHGIWLMDINGENARRVITAQPGEQFFRIRWSPDGQRLACTQSVPGMVSHSFVGIEILESIDLKGGTPAVVLNKARLQDFYWVPDGRILFSVAREELYGSDSNLWAIRMDSRTGNPAGQPEQLTNWGDFSFTDFSSTKDGKRLAFLKLTSHMDVYVGALERNGTRLKTPRRLTLNDRNDWPMGWTPDSSAVVFWSDRNGSWEVFKQRLDQDTAEKIPAGSEPKWYAHFTPDGAWLLYVALSKEQVPGGSLPVKIMRVPASGGPPQEVLSAIGTIDFRCARGSPPVCVFNEVKGDQTVFTSFDPMKGRGHEIARENFLNSSGAASFDLSSDGSLLAVAHFDPQVGRIRLVSLRDGTVSEVVVKDWNRFWQLDWAPDGRGLYVGAAMPEGGAVVYVDLQGHARLLWQGRGNLATTGRPSPNGRYLAIANTTTNANAWVIENY